MARAETVSRRGSRSRGTLIVHIHSARQSSLKETLRGRARFPPVMSSIPGMAETSRSRTPRAIKVLLYSDDIATRDAVRIGVGKRPAKDVLIESWRECATAAAVIDAADNEALDLLILDGEATPVGGMGLTKQLKNEIFQCPPIIVLTGRPSDGWLASWSQADAAVSHPIDPLELSSTIAAVARRHGRLVIPTAG